MCHRVRQFRQREWQQSDCRAQLAAGCGCQWWNGGRLHAGEDGGKAIANRCAQSGQDAQDDVGRDRRRPDPDEHGNTEQAKHEGTDARCGKALGQQQEAEHAGKHRRQCIQGRHVGRWNVKSSPCKQCKRDGGIGHTDDQVDAGIAAPAEIDAARPCEHEQHNAAEKNPAECGRHRPQHRDGNTHQHEAAAPDRTEQKQAYNIGSRHDGNHFN